MGGAYNNEEFTPVFNPELNRDTLTPSRQSFEAFIGTELNLYDIGDLSLLTNITVYPSVVSPEEVEDGRVRAVLILNSMPFTIIYLSMISTFVPHSP